ncbi:hypothetical protein VP96_02498 [Vibrio cholerae]|nr:hypothetical protein VCHE39_1747 [Vibrio cholerae HE39]KKP10324.1 hypothetical protein VP96_02498 [Vibrio cholerae]
MMILFASVLRSAALTALAFFEAFDLVGVSSGVCSLLE